MTVQELIDLLSTMNPEAEVRIAHQPSYPFELSVGNVLEADVTDEQDEIETDTQVVYIDEGKQLGYLPGEVKSALW